MPPAPTVVAGEPARVPALIESAVMPVVLLIASVGAESVPPSTITAGACMVVPEATVSVAAVSTVTLLAATAAALATWRVPAATVVGPV